MVDKKDIQEKVTAIVLDQLSIEENQLSLTSSFFTQGADELDCIEIVMRIEEEFNIEINDSDAEKLTSVFDIVEYVHKL